MEIHVIIASAWPAIEQALEMVMQPFDPKAQRKSAILRQKGVPLTPL